MAIFNPQGPQNQERDWTNVSRPISDIPADKSTALAISATGDALESGVKIAETVQQDIIKEKTRAGVESLRDATTVAYDTTRAALIKGEQPPTAAANVAGLSLLQKGNANVPESLQAGLDRAEDLATARAQGTLRANDTLYTGALNALAKQLRAEYPGHKDFVDEQIARISGKNPANAYMDNLLTDISRLATGTDSMEKKIVSQAFQNSGDPAVYMALKKYQMAPKAPGSLDGLFNAVHGAEAEKLNHQKTMNDVQEQEAAGKIDLSKVRYQAQQSAAATFNRNFNGLLETQGLTGAKITQIINESKTGQITSITPNQWESIAQQMEAMRDMSLNQVKSNFNATGISKRFATSGNTAEENTIINNEAQFFDRAIAAIRSPDKGTFFEMQRRAKGMQDATNYQVMQTEMGEWLRKMDVIKEKAGPNWVSMVDATTLKANMLGRMTSWMNEKTQLAGVGEDPRLGNVGKSLTADIQQAKRIAAQGTQFDPRLYQDLVQNVDLITKANEMGKPEVAKELVKYMFDPTRNADFVKQWSRDFKDSNGVEHKGYFAYYDLMTRPGIADAIHKLGDREAWNMYKGWQETNFRQLFGNETQTLNDIVTSTKYPSTLHWNTESQSMEVVFKYPPQSTQDRDRMNYYRDAVSKLNNGLANISYMYGKEGTEPNEGIFTMLRQMEFKPNDRLTGSSLPQQVLEAIAASQFKPSAEDRLKGSFERLGRGGSVPKPVETAPASTPQSKVDMIKEYESLLDRYNTIETSKEREELGKRLVDLRNKISDSLTRGSENK